MSSFNLSDITTIEPSNFWTTEKPYRLDDPTQRLLVAIFTCTISFVGIPGNILVIFAVCISRNLQTSTNAFVVNLAFSDLITFLVLPFNTAALLEEEWPLPDSVCKLVSALTHISAGASIVNLALIAFNRYYLITRPRSKYDQLYGPRNMVLMITFSWLYVIAVIIVPPACDFGRRVLTTVSCLHNRFATPNCVL
ncbi:Muscarinic acetylcholine receptor M4 [Holothuria leucospilota]|uniref:Muscarinic acetylcholine receptor M4 n=1 Tax=Holothuria leucospilota TaxID=206669 RepID=A0A9Q0YKY9_HOLLE|nr:Muscarinic acetylcholine receptor M4 [Holothuria leucospilota]